MDINEATLKYGREFVHELIDIALIANFKVNREYWYNFALRHGLIKRTTKIVREWCQRDENYWYYKTLPDGTSKYGRWEDSQIQYKFILKNGSSRYLLNLFFTQPQMEEWLNETNPNQAESAQS